jgi:hypothetical protein
VPKERTTEHKRKHVEIRQCLLDHYNNEGKGFLSKKVTREEI